MMIVCAQGCPATALAARRRLCWQRGAAAPFLDVDWQQ